MKKIKYAVFVANYIIMPFTVLMYKRAYPKAALSYLGEQMFFFIPLFSVWWEMLLLKSYIDDDGKELLRTYKKNVVFDIICYFLAYLIFHLPIFWFAMTFVDRWFFQPELLFSQCFMYAGVLYGASMWLNSITIPFALICAYSLYALRLDTFLERIKLNVQTPAYYILAGVVFMVIGCTCRTYRE